MSKAVSKKPFNAQTKPNSVVSPKKGGGSPNPSTPTLHDNVVLENNLKGAIKFIGNIKDKEGIFYGVELSEAKGKNDGSVDGISYFKCNAKKGLFVTQKKILQIMPSLASKNYPRVTCGDRVKIPSKKCNGTIRYIGEPSFKEGIWYGVELDEPNGKNNGTVMNRCYFICDENKGTFLKHKEIIPLSSSLPTSPKKPINNKVSEVKNKKDEEKKEDEKKEEKEVEIEIKIGDKILIKPSKQGQIKYIGEAKYLGEGIWIGVRLTEKRGTCNGEYKGHKFFTCPDGYGIYIRKRDIIKKLDDQNWDYMNEENEINSKKEEKLLHLKEQKDYLLKIKNQFKNFDIDGNKTIDIQEWNQLALNLNLSGVNENNLLQIFNEIDVSKSGNISFAEFEKWYLNIIPNDEKQLEPTSNDNHDIHENNDNNNNNNDDDNNDISDNNDNNDNNDNQNQADNQVVDEVTDNNVQENVTEPNNIPI